MPSFRRSTRRADTRDRVYRYLLDHPTDEFSAIHLADRLTLSAAYVHALLIELEGFGLVARRRGGVPGIAAGWRAVADPAGGRP